MAGENSHGKEKRHITLRCRVTDTTDVHIKCQDLWWTREIDQIVHREVVIGRKKYKSFQTGYQAEMIVPLPNEEFREVYSCHALCGLQTFTATCHLKDMKSKTICSRETIHEYLSKGNNSWVSANYHLLFPLYITKESFRLLKC